MPLVRLDVIRGRSPQELKQLLDTVQEVLERSFNAPKRDRCASDEARRLTHADQVVHSHNEGELIAEDTGLGIERTNKLCIIQVTGRSAEQKQALYKDMADTLDKKGLVPKTDLIFSLVENTKEDWSFGNGEAQFLTGAL